MRRINILDTATANRIAAGEVVERPASVIKELCENSLDAGATALSIAIEAGGMKRIVVSDNGYGIHPDDVGLAFKRHATGKIESGDSLSAIETLGFRGEALSSIAAVSRLRMRTRLRGEQTGKDIVIHGGEVVDDTECGCPEGTSIEVRDLFFNTPARLKFIKSTAPEAAAASDTVLRLILSNSGVSIKFTNNDKTVYHSPGSGLKDAIHAVYGRDTADGIVPMDYQNATIHIHGFLGKPEISRKTRVGQTLFVNGRFVRDNLLSEAVRDGYGQKLMIGKYPFFVLNVEIPHTLVDVNVHPQKTEIRIANKEALFDIIRQSVYETMYDISGIRHLQTPQTAVKEDMHQVRFVEYRQHAEEEPSQLEQSLDTIKQEMGPLYKAASSTSSRLSEQDGLSAALSGHTIENREDSLLHAPMRLIGQAFSTFAIVESGDMLFYIDQHAAHERLTYDRYKDEANRMAVTSQQLLAPAIIKLTHDETHVYREYSEHFKRLGFSIDMFGTADIAVRAVPMILGKPAVETMIKDIIDELSVNKVTTLADIADDMIIMSACKHSVKSRDSLDEKELQVLVNMLARNKLLTCPHGRPVAVYITRKDLEKGFKRLV